MEVGVYGKHAGSVVVENLLTVEKHFPFEFFLLAKQRFVLFPFKFAAGVFQLQNAVAIVFQRPFKVALLFLQGHVDGFQLGILGVQHLQNGVLGFDGRYRNVQFRNGTETFHLKNKIAFLFGYAAFFDGNFVLQFFHLRLYFVDFYVHTHRFQKFAHRFCRHFKCVQTVLYLRKGFFHGVKFVDVQHTLACEMLFFVVEFQQQFVEFFVVGVKSGNVGKFRVDCLYAVAFVLRQSKLTLFFLQLPVDVCQLVFLPLQLGGEGVTAFFLLVTLLCQRLQSLHLGHKHGNFVLKRNNAPSLLYFFLVCGEVLITLLRLFQFGGDFSAYAAHRLPCLHFDKLRRYCGNFLRKGRQLLVGFVQLLRRDAFGWKRGVLTHTTVHVLPLPTGFEGRLFYFLLHFRQHLYFFKLRQIAVKIFHGKIVDVRKAQHVLQTVVKNLFYVIEGVFVACHHLPTPLGVLFQHKACFVVAVQFGKRVFRSVQIKNDFHVPDIFRFFAETKIHVGIEPAPFHGDNLFALACGAERKGLFLFGLRICGDNFDYSHAALPICTSYWQTVDNAAKLW